MHIWILTKSSADHDLNELRLDEISIRGTQIHFMGVSIALAGADESLTLETLGIKEGVSMLLWNGTNVNEELYDPDVNSIAIQVTYYSSPDQPSPTVQPTICDFTIKIGQTDCLSVLKEKIARQIGLPAESQYVCKLEYQKVTNIAENNVSALDLGLYNESRIIVESLPQQERVLLLFATLLYYFLLTDLYT